MCIGGSGVCVMGGGGGGGGGEAQGAERERMKSGWEVLVLPVIFIRPCYCAILFPFVNSILGIHCQI